MLERQEKEPKVRKCIIQSWRQAPNQGMLHNSLEHHDVRGVLRWHMTASGHAYGSTNAESRDIFTGGTSQAGVQERTGVWAKGLRGWPLSFIPITLNYVRHQNDLRRWLQMETSGPCCLIISFCRSGVESKVLHLNRCSLPTEILIQLVHN